MITNIKNDGFDYTWNTKENFSQNLDEFIKIYTAKKLAEYFLKTKTLRWEGESYREIFTTSSMLDTILLYHFDELGKTLWKNVLSHAIAWDKLEKGFEEKAMNVVFRHKEADIDYDILMSALVPLISKSNVYKRSHTDNMELNHDMVLPYFKALNDKITKRKADEIFEDFDKNGSTFLGIPAQNWLIDNNKYIRKIIEEGNLINDYPPKTVRDIFIF